jgi:uncharacterized delta-60 repeat protein
MPKRHHTSALFLLAATTATLVGIACDDADDVVAPLPEDDASPSDGEGEVVLDAASEETGDEHPFVCAPGTLDIRFGQGGVAPPIFGAAYAANAYAMALEPSTGKILVAGTARDPKGDATVRSFALARYLPDGQPDTTFGNAGVVVTKLGTTAGFNDVAYLPDGRIVAVGVVSQDSHLDCAVACYSQAGALDTTFAGGKGIATVRIGTECTATAVSIGAGGVITLAAYADSVSATHLSMTAIRLTANGALDSSLADAGWLQTNLSGKEDRATDITVEDGGALLLAGSLDSLPASPTSRGALLRYDRLGKADKTFGDGGAVLFPTGTLAGGIASGDGGSIYASGFSPDGGSWVARLSAHGALDATFADGGLAKAQSGPFISFAMKRVALQSDGKIVLTGWGQEDDTSTFLVPRFDANGALDPTFGAGGVAVGPAGTVGADIAVQPNGRILVAGTGRDPTNKLEFIVAGLCP